MSVSAEAIIGSGIIINLEATIVDPAVRLVVRTVIRLSARLGISILQLISRFFYFIFALSYAYSCVHLLSVFEFI